MEFREAVRRIIQPIRSNFVFDSHYVIDRAIKGHTDEYLVFAAQYSKSEHEVKDAHR